MHITNIAPFAKYDKYSVLKTIFKRIRFKLPAIINKNRFKTGQFFIVIKLTLQYFRRKNDIPKTCMN